MKTHGFIYLFIGLASLLGLLIAFVTGIDIGLSFSQKEYETNLVPVLSMIGVWVGAFATSSAVIVSLWLALKQLRLDKEILVCRLDMMVIDDQLDVSLIGLFIVSKGTRPANISSVTWHGESAQKSIFVQQFDKRSEKLPKVLSYGETITILFEPNLENYLYDYVIDNLEGTFEELYLSVNTTTESKKVKVCENVLSSIRKSKEC
jgi:hypothetical protein